MLKTRSVTGLQNINRINTDNNVCYDDTLKANDSNKHGPSTHEKNSHIKGGLRIQQIHKNLYSEPLQNETQESCSTTKLRILVARQDDSKMTAFLMKKEDPMEKLFRRYSMLVGVDTSHLRFLFDGYKVNDEDTPTILEMKNNDVLEVYQLAYNDGKCYFKNCCQNKNR